MDVAILGDISKSMSEGQRKATIELVHKLVENLGVSPAGNHFALGTFGSNGEIAFNFNDPKYHNKKRLKKAAKKRYKKRPKKYGTRMDLAMDQAVREVFTPDGGDRPNAKNIMLLITDGKPYIAKWDKKPFIPFSKSTKALEVIFSHLTNSLLTFPLMCGFIA